MANTPLVRELSCLRCAWTWYPRNPEPPKVCPKCKRPDWNEAKKP